MGTAPADAEYWIEKLQLQPHVEGGYFRETYRSEEKMLKGHLPARYPSERPLSTAIYFLLRGSETSRFHRLRSDEIWHYYKGSPLLLHVIDGKGGLNRFELGVPNFQAVIEAGCWFGAEVSEPDSYSLIGCTLAPGFEFEDLELGRRDRLLASYPAHQEVIKRLTPP
jgi:uncharacterized protein